MDNFFRKDGDSLICLLCSHYCKLKKDEIGLCGVNRNSGEEIENLVYGYLSAVNLDPIEKKPLYHFLPNSKSLSIGTIGCNFKCPFCENWKISQIKEIPAKYYTPYEIVNLAIENGAESISYTYNEPTIFWPYAKDVATIAKSRGLKNIFVTNGFQSREVIEDMKDLIDAVNVDLKSSNPKYYRRELNGNIDIVKENLKLFKESGIWVEITTLVIPNINDLREELNEIASFIVKELSYDTPWHISAFTPAYKLTSIPKTDLRTLKIALQEGLNAGLRHIYIDNANLQAITFCDCTKEVIIRDREVKNYLQNGKCPECNRKMVGIV